MAKLSYKPASATDKIRLCHKLDNFLIYNGLFFKKMNPAVISFWILDIFCKIDVLKYYTKSSGKQQKQSS